MAKKLKGTSPCGFSFITPHSEDDAINVIQYHVKFMHKKEYPKRNYKGSSIEKHRRSLVKFTQKGQVKSLSSRKGR